MPISPDRKALYPPDWKQISLRIRERDGNCCKVCGVPNGTYIAREKANLEHWQLWTKAPNDGKWTGAIKVVLTVAHLNHSEADCRDENLASLCQLHHLRYDAQHHAENARQTRLAKKQAALDAIGQQTLL